MTNKIFLMLCIGYPEYGTHYIEHIFVVMVVVVMVVVVVYCRWMMLFVVG